MRHPPPTHRSRERSMSGSWRSGRVVRRRVASSLRVLPTQVRILSPPCFCAAHKSSTRIDPSARHIGIIWRSGRMVRRRLRTPLGTARAGSNPVSSARYAVMRVMHEMHYGVRMFSGCPFPVRKRTTTERPWRSGRVVRRRVANSLRVLPTQVRVLSPPCAMWCRAPLYRGARGRGHVVPSWRVGRVVRQRL